MNITCSCGHKEALPEFTDKIGWWCKKCNNVHEISANGTVKLHAFQFLHPDIPASFDPKGVFSHCGMSFNKHGSK